MKKLGFFVVFLSLFMLLSACSNPVQDEILSYVNDELPAIAKAEEDIIAKYSNVTGANYTDDATLYDALTNEIIPLYSDFIDKLEAIRISDKELQSIHESYIEAAKQQHKALKIMVTALENQDLTLIEEANGLLEKSQKEINVFEVNLQKYAEENNVEITILK